VERGQSEIIARGVSQKKKEVKILNNRPRNPWKTRLHRKRKKEPQRKSRAFMLEEGGTTK